MDQPQLAALDTWIAGLEKPISRPQAIRALVAAALEVVNYRDPPPPAAKPRKRPDVV